MSQWYRQLAVLSRAVHFQNLTAASQHVGLSQPQLSRLVGQLEQGLGVILLDRGVRRKTNWTPVAHRLAEVFDRSEQGLERGLRDLLDETITRELKVACLEGLASLAVGQLGLLAKSKRWRMIQIDVLDQTELEERFLAGSVDVVWTSRVPGKRKPRHQLSLGYQSLDERDSEVATEIYSSFEFARERKQEPSGLRIVSNSLRVRELWFETWGGRGRFPSTVHVEPKAGRNVVLLLGGEILSESVWHELVQVTRK